MSDRLNDDVLKLIVDELAPLSYDLSSYRNVKRTPLSLCRTSRGLRILAQPLVWRHVRVEGRKQLEQLRAGTATTGFGRYTVAYEVESPFSHSVDDLLDVADLLPNVVKLRVSVARAPVDIALVLHRFALERLELHNVVFDDTLPTASHTLQHLVIIDSVVSKLFMRHWLTPSCLPALRTIRIDRTTELSDWLSSGVKLDEILARSLRAQPAAARRTLREIYSAIDKLEAVPSYEPPVVVVLPRHIAALAVSAAVVVRQVFKEFEQLCVTQRVRIVWASEGPPGFEGPLSLGLDDFWRYARELKAARTGAAGR
ncbi:hypothetical protein JCM9279_005000 [Rhodotorula babjevae]